MEFVFFGTGYRFREAVGKVLRSQPPRTRTCYRCSALIEDPTLEDSVAGDDDGD
jgi:hypothetical protein